MRVRPAILGFTLLLALSCVHGRPTSAQAIVEPSTPTLKVYSRETVVDVTVTDAKGNPVHGLTQADFTVKEDGKPQPIRSFEEFSTQPTKPLPKLPHNVYTNLQPPAASGAVNILWLDFTNDAPVVPIDYHTPSIGAPDQARAMGDQHHIKQYATQYLQGMPPGTRVAVLGSSFPSSLRVLQGITSDPALLSAAINTMPYDMHAFATTKLSWDAEQDMRKRMTLESLDQMAADFAAVKGKKNLIWFTIGIPGMTDPQWSNGPDYTQDLLKAYSLLAAAQVAVFPISVRGVYQGSVPSVIGRPMPPIAAEQLSMESVAEATGGAAFYNSNDLAALISQAIDKGSDYYTLTYAPPGQKYNWAHHTINVAVDKPGLHLVYRKTYDAVDPATIKPTPGLTLGATPPEVRNGNMQAAMSRSMPTSQDILFDVQVEPTAAPANSNPAFPPGTILGTLDPAVKAKLKGKPLVRYGFQYAIPALQIAFSPGPNGTHKGSLELDLAAYDTDGKLVTGLSQTVKMPLSDTRYRQFIQGPFRFLQQIDLPPGQLFLRIGVLDPASNKVGTLEIPFTVPKK